MRKYEHLFFDLDNTLWDFDANSKEALRITFNEYDLNKKQIQIEAFYNFYKNVNNTLWEAYRKKQIFKSELIKTRFQKTMSHFNITDIDPVTMNDRYLENMAKQTVLINGVIETLNYLKSKSYKMHIITNGFVEVQNNKLKNSGLQNYFSNIFTSEEIKYPKPDKRIFQHALKSCNAKKSKSIMIGDSWEADILGAYRFGIDQIYFSGSNSLTQGAKNEESLLNSETPTNYNRSKPTTHKITDLKEIMHTIL